MNVSILEKNIVKASNWRGVDYLPPIPKPFGKEGWAIPVYIKVFIDSSDVGAARRKLDQLAPDVELCWPNSIVMDKSLQSARTDAWSFSILPSMGEDLEPLKRLNMLSPENRAWQMEREISSEDKIDSGDSVEAAVIKAIRQYKRGLKPAEISEILKASGLDLSGYAGECLKLDVIDTFPNVESYLQQEGDSKSVRLAKQ
jgi:hypothetical protein